MEISQKRQLLGVLRGIIGSGFTGTQDELREQLGQKGYEVTQSTVSRALKKLGVIKISLEEGGSRYELKTQGPIKSFGGRISDLVLDIQSNESMIVLKTTPGSAMFIAGYVDHYCKDDILGTIAGDDTIFVSPLSTKKVDFHKSNILNYIERN